MFPVVGSNTVTEIELLKHASKLGLETTCLVFWGVIDIVTICSFGVEKVSKVITQIAKIIRIFAIVTVIPLQETAAASK